MCRYLLEKVRLTYQSTGERNYHVFYQLFNSGDDAVLRSAGVDGVKSLEDFHYLGQSGCTSMRYESDDAGYRATTAAFDVMGLTATEVTDVWRCLGALLNLGNVTAILHGDHPNLVLLIHPH